jgi:photosystem II stability/assembly factor-like uncharacterized protein
MFVTAKKMNNPVVEKTIRILIAIAFSVTAAMAQGRGYTIQVESALTEADASASAAKLRALGMEAYWVKTTVPNIGVRYRVRIGRYPNQTQARAKADQLLSAGLIKEFIIATYDTSPSDSATPDETKPVTSSSNSPGRSPARTNDKSDPREKKNTPGMKAESGPGATRPRKTSNPEPAASARAIAEVPPDVTINNENWRIVKHGLEIDKNLRAIHFIDSTTGWAAGEAGVVYQTTDGGRNWALLSSGGASDISFIYFIDWNRGWMIGKSDGKMGYETPGDNILFITTNGGRAWTHRSLPDVTKVHFIDARTGWAVGKNSTLLKTTDGGLAWERFEDIDKLIGSPIESSFGFADIKFPDARHGWLIGNYYNTSRGEIGGVFTTSDGGETWRRVPFTIQTKNNSGASTPGLLHSAHFANAIAGSITGEMYDGDSRFFFALHTRDGGASWSLFRIPSQYTHNSQFVDPARGWTSACAQRAGGGEVAGYDTTLLRTDNGGLSWRIDFTARGRRVRGVFFSSPTRGWAVGDRGMILAYEEKPKAN